MNTRSGRPAIPGAGSNPPDGAPAPPLPSFIDSTPISDYAILSQEFSMPDQNATLQRLNEQIDWYDRKSNHNQHWYKVLRGVTMVAGALVPVISLGMANAGRLYTAGLGVIIVIAEGWQQLNQFQANWISYRSTCETLKHEKFLYLATAGPYASAADPGVLLAERLEGTVSQEHAKWVSGHEQNSKKPTGKTD